jgi:catechol 2,3-dioxygenase-like lactoylglutathione lyase family enzyme
MSIIHFRYARHTQNLEAIIAFYTSVLGLSVLGSFENHDTYDGVFLGMENESWHLEFTTSPDIPEHVPDEDDVLVFYVRTEKEQQAIARKAYLHGCSSVKSKNPYWQEHGIQIQDPDDFGIILAVRRT